MIGIATIREMNLGAQKRLYREAKEAYYNGPAAIMEDADFDKLERIIRKAEPEWSGLKQVRAAVKSERIGKKVEVPLTVPMPSLDKALNTEPGPLKRFLERTPEGQGIVIMPKYDGASVEGVYRNRKFVRLSTAGDGVTGKDITFLAPHINFPKELPANAPTGTITVRFEAIVPRAVWQEKFADDFASDRHMASSITNRQDVHPGLKHLVLIALRVFLNGKAFVQMHRELYIAKRCGFDTAHYLAAYTTGVHRKMLEEHLKFVRSKSRFTLDGLVLHHDGKCDPTEDNPDYAIAFKNNEDTESRVTVIEEVVWQVSHSGRCVPKAQIKPVKFDGVTVTFATMHNAEWMKSAKLGVGAKVRIIRSGEIIPKIVEVIEPGKFAPPTVKEVGGKVEWRGVHLYLADTEGHEEVMTGLLNRVFETLGIDHAGESLARAFAKSGCPGPVALIKVLYSNPLEALAHAGLSAKMAAKIAAEIPKSVTLPVLMKATAIFDEGFGERRFTKIVQDDWYETFPRSVSWDSAVEVLGEVFGTKYCDKHAEFARTLRSELVGVPLAAPTKKRTVKGALTGHVVTQTGYRDADEVAFIESHGGTVDSFSSKTTILLYRANGKASSKVETARARGIKVATFAQLKAKLA